ncbi:MAG: chemotaxis protein CheW [Pseudomonadales bacterium]
MSSATTTTANPEHDPAGAQQHCAQYLTFLLDGEEYGIDILSVQEIKGWQPCTELPNTPDYVLGVINLRGAVIPVIDLRRRLGMAPRDAGKLTVVIVIRHAAADGEKVLGVVVDAVSDVFDIAPDQVSAPPSLEAGLDGRFVRGLATLADKMIILLDLAHVAGDA